MPKDFPGIYLSKVVGVWVGDAPVTTDGGLPEGEWPLWARNHCWLAVKNPRLAGDNPIFCQPKSSFGGRSGLGRMELPQIGYFVFMYWVVGEPNTTPFWEGTYWPEGSPPAEARTDNRIILMDSAGNILYAQDGSLDDTEPQLFVVGGKNLRIQVTNSEEKAYIDLKDDGEILIANEQGASIRLKDDTVYLN